MIVFPNAKLNLGLHVVGRRADGYHLLDTCFYPIPLKDTLELHARPTAEADSLRLFGVEVSGEATDNLVMRAVRATRGLRDFPPVELHLMKTIPTGAGMGGGSADATFTLLGLNKLFDLRLSEGELHGLALSLGADCPFFLENRACLGRGIGEELTPIELNLEGYYLVLLKPNLHISTAEAFGGLKHVGAHSLMIEEIIYRPIEDWRELLDNDFEASLFPQYPILSDLKRLLYDKGAIYASMTGSGATLFGLFKEEQDWLRTERIGAMIDPNGEREETTRKQYNYFTWQTKL